MHYQRVHNRYDCESILQYVQALRCMSKDPDFEPVTAIDHSILAVSIYTYIQYTCNTVRDAFISGLLFCLLTFYSLQCLLEVIYLLRRCYNTG